VNKPHLKIWKREKICKSLGSLVKAYQEKEQADAIWRAKLVAGLLCFLVVPLFFVSWIYNRLLKHYNENCYFSVEPLPSAQFEKVAKIAEVGKMTMRAAGLESKNQQRCQELFKNVLFSEKRENLRKIIGTIPKPGTFCTSAFFGSKQQIKDL